MGRQYNANCYLTATIYWLPIDICELWLIYTIPEAMYVSFLIIWFNEEYISWFCYNKLLASGQIPPFYVHLATQLNSIGDETR